MVDLQAMATPVLNTGLAWTVLILSYLMADVPGVSRRQAEAVTARNTWKATNHWRSIEAGCEEAIAFRHDQTVG